MIANPAVSPPAAIPPPFTLNDLRTQGSVGEKRSSTFTPKRTGIAVAVVLAIGAFLWLDPLSLFTPTEASPPKPAFVPTAEPARSSERQEIIAPSTPVHATKSIEVPIAPAPVVQAQNIPALAVRPRAASLKPEARNATVLQASPKEKTTPPLLLTNPEERADAPIVLKLGDDTKGAPRPAATIDQTPATE